LIKPDGTVIEKVQEGAGNTCLMDTALLESALGEVVSRELLPEYYENMDNTVVVNSEVDY
jgi:hypothetical protein